MKLPFFTFNAEKKSTKKLKPSSDTGDRKAQNQKIYSELLNKLNKSKLNTKDLKNAVNKKGYHLRTTDGNGNTILHHLANSEKKYNDIIKYMMKAEKKLANAQNKKNDTPLHLLLQSKYKDKLKIFKLFIKSGTDISIQNKDGNNILHIIALLNEEEKIQYLNIILGATNKTNEILNKSTNAKNNQNRTPIQVAIIEQGNKVQSQQKSFFQKLRTNKSYLTGQTQCTINFCVKLLLRTGQQNKAAHLNLPAECKHRSSQHILTEIYNRTSERPIKKNMDSKVKLLFAGLISATIFSAASGYMTIAAGLSISIAVCAAYYVISALINSLLSPYFNRSQDMNQSTINQSGNLEEQNILSTTLSCISPIKGIKGAINCI